MVEFEIDGKTVTGESGANILEIALKEGKYIPHFCYHKKLSIAANCRMCLVEVEKSAKPLPACATPITDGMKVFTHSKLAKESQKAVMEFLLINHPLDCPICDQGGECQLQDIAVGYGQNASRYEENKRAVSNKELGPLVSTEMTRCIHCSRCVRFTDEIAGLQELGMSYRNNHVEVMPFIGQTLKSELSGNIIDICPVGALTSTVFRHHARNWELSRRKSIAPHDSLGSNIIAQVDKYHKVVRVLPLEKEELNECWLSDRDRFSYEGLYHKDRILSPMIKYDNKWHEVDWDTALNYVVKTLTSIINENGVDSIGVLASAISTTEELYLLQKLMRQMGINNLDHRLMQQDFDLDNLSLKVEYLGANIDEFLKSKSILVIGSLIRQEHPILAAKIRKAVKLDLELNVINIIKEDLLCKVKNQITCDPRNLVEVLAQLVKATLKDEYEDLDLSEIIVTPEILPIVESLKKQGFIVFGEIARMHPEFSKLVLLGQQLAKNIGAKFGFLLSNANDVGANLVGFLPYKKAFNEKVTHFGMNVLQMLSQQLKAYVLFNTELEYDIYDAKLALNALNRAKSVIVMNAFINDNIRAYADVILPITPFTETAGSFVNFSGLWQKFNAVTKPYYESKPAWKILRVLGNLFHLSGFDFNTIEDVRNEIINIENIESYLGNCYEMSKITINNNKFEGIMRVSLNNIYAKDSILRRADSLQATHLATTPVLLISKYLANKLDINNEFVELKQDGYARKFKAHVSDSLPDLVIALTFNNETYGFSGRLSLTEINN